MPGWALMLEALLITTALHPAHSSPKAKGQALAVDTPESPGKPTN